MSRFNGKRAEFEASGEKINVAILGAGRIAHTMANTLVEMATDRCIPHGFTRMPWLPVIWIVHRHSPINGISTKRMVRMRIWWLTRMLIWSISPLLIICMPSRRFCA